jgi:drug/metabolite transporter (DMT)-like permease
LLVKVPSLAVIGSCAATAVLAALFHLWLESFTVPTGATQWLAILGLGLGPVGLAFYFWDEGMKRGDIRLLGVASYATPLLSTLVMTALGLGQATAWLWLAAALITAGALLAAKDALARR